MSAPTIRISAEHLTGLVERLFTSLGSGGDEARLVARNLVASDLSGHPSHGVGMLPAYVDAALDGRLRLNAQVREVTRAGSMVVLDGCRGLGQSIGVQAMDAAIALARHSGLALVALGNSYHLGRIGHWGEICAAADLVSLHFVNVVGHPGLVSPRGGRDARLGTDPVCIAIPRRGSDPILLDFATSRLAMGKVREAHLAGRPVPGGTLLDAGGIPTTDPAVMFTEPRGMLLPFGDHKGHGLALVCDLLAGFLVGSAASERSMSGDSILNNMLSILFDPARLADGPAVFAEIESFVRWVKASAPDGDVVLPGEPESRHRIEASGIVTLSPGGWEAVRNALVKGGLPPEQVAPLS